MMMYDHARSKSMSMWRSGLDYNLQDRSNKTIENQLLQKGIDITYLSQDIIALVNNCTFVYAKHVFLMLRDARVPFDVLRYEDYKDILEGRRLIEGKMLEEYLKFQALFRQYPELDYKWTPGFLSSLLAASRPYVKANITSLNQIFYYKSPDARYEIRYFRNHKTLEDLMMCSMMKEKAWQRHRFEKLYNAAMISTKHQYIFVVPQLFLEFLYVDRIGVDIYFYQSVLEEYNEVLNLGLTEKTRSFIYKTAGDILKNFEEVKYGRLVELAREVNYSSRQCRREVMTPEAFRHLAFSSIPIQKGKLLELNTTVMNVEQALRDLDELDMEILLNETAPITPNNLLKKLRKLKEGKKWYDSRFDEIVGHFSDESADYQADDYDDESSIETAHARSVSRHKTRRPRRSRSTNEAKSGKV